MVAGERVSKCAKYWPNVGETLACKDLKVETLIETCLDKLSCAMERKIKVTFSRSGGEEGAGQAEQESLWVTQLHYLGWPDYSVPSLPSSLLLLCERVHDIEDEIQQAADG